MKKFVVKNIRGYFNENGEIYLYLKDIVYGLEFTKTTLTLLEEQVKIDKERVLSCLNILGKNYEKIRAEFISEEIFYKLSDFANVNDKTEAFKKFIKNEVIPKVRRQWAFTVENKDTDELILAKALLISKNIIKKLENKVKALENYKNNEILRFDSEIDYNTFLRINKQFFSLEQLATEFGVTEKKLKEVLKEEEMIFIVGEDWIPSRKLFEEKFALRKIIRIKDCQEKKKVFWTLDGKEKIGKILKKLKIK